MKVSKPMAMQTNICRPMLKVVKLSEHAKLPSRGSCQAAGLDLYSAQHCLLKPWSKEVIDTDIQIQLPSECYGRIAPRSSLAAKHSLDVGAGVIDPDFRGHVQVVLFNLGEKEYRIARGDRIAQLILEKNVNAAVLEVTPGSLQKSKRGEGGFGSSD